MVLFPLPMNVPIWKIGCDCEAFSLPPQMASSIRSVYTRNSSVYSSGPHSSLRYLPPHRSISLLISKAYSRSGPSASHTRFATSTVDATPAVLLSR